jgi:DNA-binding beta-propeller fold protein YncE
MRSRSGRIPVLPLLAIAVTAAVALFVVVMPRGARPSLPEASPMPGVASKPRVWQTIGERGEAPGQLQQPRGITGLADGSFVVVDRMARVQHFSADGQPLHLWSMFEHNLGNPKGITALPDGNLLVCDTHYGRVLIMSIDGKLLQTWGTPGLGPAQFTHPLSAAVDAARSVAYVVEYGAYNDRIQKFKLDGTFLKAWGKTGDQPGELSRPSGITLDKDGNVFVADACNHRIQKFDPEGKLLNVFGKMGTNPGELRYPYDIAAGPDGLLYVAEFNNHRVSVWDVDGNFVRHIGGPGAGEMQFANPWSLTVDARGRLLVSDTGNHRIQIIDLALYNSSLAQKPQDAPPLD